METRDLTVPDLLFLTCQTSGLYRDDLAMEDPGQPWCMQLAAMLCNKSGATTNAFNHLVKAEGRAVKETAAKVHGISANATARIGVPESRVLGMLTDMLKTAPMTALKVVTYGDHDRKIIASLIARFAVSLGKPSSAFDRLWFARPGIEFVNLMNPWAQQVCRLPGEFEDGSFRWPSLDEAAAAILGRGPREGLHDALADVSLIRDLYLRLAADGYFAREAAAA